MADGSLEYHPEARAELLEAHSWYSGIGEALGQKFLDELYRSAQRVVQYPRSYPTTYRVFHSCLLNTFPYKIVYRVRQSRIYVLAIAHTSKRPGYWRRRA